MAFSSAPSREAAPSRPASKRARRPPATIHHRARCYDRVVIELAMAGGDKRRGLAPVGVAHIDMPATPERVWRAIRDAR